MKKQQVIVTDRSGIPAAAELAERVAERAAAEKPGRTEDRVCPLVCEELILRMLSAGCAKVTVTARGRRFRYVEISGAGEPADPAAEKNAEGDLGTQISGCILEQYADSYDHRYRGGVHVYRVFAGQRNTLDLSKEIYAFYREQKPGKPPRPTDVLRYLASRHRGPFTLSVMILLVKHLAALMLPVFVANIINLVTKTGVFFSWEVLLNIALSLLSLSVNLICFWIDSRGYRRATRAVEAGFRLALVQKLQALSMRFHTGLQSGAVLSKLVSDVQFIQMLIYDRFQEVLYALEDVVFIVVIALLNFPLMLAFYAVIVPLTVFLLRRFSKKLLEKRAGMRKENEQVGAAVKEMLEMEGLVRAQGMGKTEYRKILSRVRRAQRAAVVYDRQTVSINNISYGAFQGLRLLSLSFAALLTAAGHISVGTLVLFQSIFEMIIANVQRLLDAVPLITQGLDSLKSVGEILMAEDVERNGEKLLPGPLRGEIEFRHVTFGYESDKEPVLRDVSFRVPPRGSVAFVGKSGEGKTTMLSLILGMYSPWEGQILVDGNDLETLEKNAYRRGIAVVPQQTVLFAGTLWDNLVYGLNYASPDRVREVIRRVGLEELVESLPEGLNSPILENGGNLSGGQRQRIAIARALLREPKIVLLDEATSALDSASEKQVQAAIDAIMGHCTVIMVAHRINTLRRADTIYRVVEGRLEKYDSFEQVERDMEGGLPE